MWRRLWHFSEEEEVEHKNVQDEIVAFEKAHLEFEIEKLKAQESAVQRVHEVLQKT